MLPANPAQHPNFPDNFPAWWAGAWGEDEIGLWMTLIFNDQTVQQTFRWIEPGTFQMGSPKNEKERHDDETQHTVRLSQGYWLADTACTQALWQAVMNDNPANFKENLNNPVEQVSWNDVQQFMARLNKLIQNLDAGLPTEAQWEYACRAGAVESTPFSFGKKIMPEQVNYHGEYPYAGGKKGLYRGLTVPVKSLPPNAWGLYEMHGNVWEWCHDWYGAYSSEAVSDPMGPPEGVDRVLRGGSWFISGGFVRSALRDYNEPDYRDFNVGFRLALGQSIWKEKQA
jgi:formylglycine-generating enzyme required for sulfatase activity